MIQAGKPRTITALGLLALVVILASSEPIQANAVLDTVTQYMGRPPAACSQIHDLEPTLTGTIETADDTLAFYRASDCVGSLNFIVGTPSGALETSPVVIALPETGKAGAREVFGLAGDPSLSYGQTFLKAGFVVVSPEVWINGDEPDASPDWNTEKFYQRYPQWSALGRMLEDNRAVLDFISNTRPKASCIAAVGHSLGGHNAIFLSAFDRRIDVTVSSAGFESIATDTNAERWARTSWFIYAPALRAVVSAPAPRAVPFDFNDIIATIAPRSVLVLQGTDDPTWTHVKLLRNFLQGVEHTYQVHHAGERFRLAMFPGKHEFPEAEQKEALKFVTDQCVNRSSVMRK